MCAFVHLLIAAQLLTGLPAAASPTPRPGEVAVSLRLRHETDAAWRKLQALGWVQRNELRVMTALPNGRRACIAVYEGTLPAKSLATARKLPEVESIQANPAAAGR